ncbi:MAG TPA: sulfur carrier protein ThiS [Euzebya sp.]|nr:sulfur carrier protein ThiS [Euzebya sp.]
MTLQITLNGTESTFRDGTTLDAVVASLGHDPSLPGVAAAVDGHIVRRVDWPATVLSGGERIEVLTAVQGGAW